MLGRKCREPNLGLAETTVGATWVRRPFPMRIKRPTLHLVIGEPIPARILHFGGIGIYLFSWDGSRSEKAFDVLLKLCCTHHTVNIIFDPSTR